MYYKYILVPYIPAQFTTDTIFSVVMSAYLIIQNKYYSVLAKNCKKVFAILITNADYNSCLFPIY